MNGGCVAKVRVPSTDGGKWAAGFHEGTIAPYVGDGSDVGLNLERVRTDQAPEQKNASAAAVHKPRSRGFFWRGLQLTLQQPCPPFFASCFL